MTYHPNSQEAVENGGTEPDITFVREWVDGFNRFVDRRQRERDEVDNVELDAIRDERMFE